jgi:dGTPase
MLWNAWPGNENGFEGNGQTLRVLTNEDLEVHTERHGLNLCRATLLAVIKYPRPFKDLVNNDLRDSGAPCPPFKPWAPPKCIHNEEQPILDWLIEPFSAADRKEFLAFETRPGKHARTKYKTLEASIIELSDDIAYGTHDVEDAFFSGLISPETIIGYMDKGAFADPAVYDKYVDLITRMGKGIPGAHARDQVYEKKGAASALISAFITAARLAELPQFENPHLRWNAALPPDDRLALDALRLSVADVVINGPAVQSLEFRGGTIILKLFDALANTPELIGGKPGHLVREAPDDTTRLRSLTDYIAGMTDNYAERLYNRLFQPGAGSIFDRQ